MQSRNDFDTKMSRVFEATGAKNDTALAHLLDIRPASVAGARKRQLVPGAWIEKIARDYNANANWLFFGTGSMRQEGLISQEHGAVTTRQLAETAKGASAEDNAKQLTVANERLYQALEGQLAMQKEIGELKAENARQQERIAALDARLEEKQVMIDGFLELHKRGADCEIVDSAPPCAPFRNRPGSEFNNKK